MKRQTYFRPFFGLTLFILLFPSISKADTRYKLATGMADIIDGRVFVIACADADVAATKFDTKTKAFSVTDATFSTDRNYIYISDDKADNILEVKVKYEANENPNFKGYDWAFSIIGGNYINFLNDGSGMSVVNNFDDKEYVTNTSAFPITKLSFESECAPKIVFYNGHASHKDNSLKFSGNPIGGDCILTCVLNGAEDTHDIRLYYKEVYDMYVVNPKPCYHAGDKLKIHVNALGTSASKKEPVRYAFSEPNVSFGMNDIFDNANGSIRESEFSEDSCIEIEYPGGDKKLWLLRRHASLYEADILVIDLIESKGTTGVEAGHYTVPDAGSYDKPATVTFERQDDVKIYYTLDGNDPVAPWMETTSSTPAPAANIADDETEDEQGSDTAEHAGKTYDLDVRPLQFDGNQMLVKFIAVKAGYDPGEVHTLTFTGISTGLDDIIMDTDDNSKADYYDIHGRHIPTPSAPGLYIRVSGDKAQKIIIR